MSVKAVVRMRSGLTLALILLSACAALAQQNPDLQVRLSLANGKDSYRGGEPIILEVTFTARALGYRINEVTTEPASPVDQVLLSPAKGIYPWLDDYSRERRYFPDFDTSNELQPGQPVTIELPLNALYRFDEPGRYTVHVVTSRIASGDFLHPKAIAALTSNDVSFDTVPMDDADEAAMAEHLESLIRSARDLRTAQRYASQLQWLTGDPSTRVKLSLFLHPKEFYPFGVDVSNGLWVARNRALVVSTLEQAMSDPRQPIGPVGSVLQVAGALKSRLESPYDPASTTNPLPQGNQIEDDYVRRIAATLPLRRGANLASTGITLLVSLVQRGKTGTLEFEAAREAVITHFADVNEYQVDWVLYGYGKYLEDPRMIPALENMLGTIKFNTTHAALENQLAALRAKN
jgi:hypothetical protein